MFVCGVYERYIVYWISINQTSDVQSLMCFINNFKNFQKSIYNSESMQNSFCKKKKLQFDDFLNYRFSKKKNMFKSILTETLIKASSFEQWFQMWHKANLLAKVRYCHSELNELSPLQLIKCSRPKWMNGHFWIISVSCRTLKDYVGKRKQTDAGLYWQHHKTNQAHTTRRKKRKQRTW